jgi:hypothetical protein
MLVQRRKDDHEGRLAIAILDAHEDDPLFAEAAIIQASRKW